MALSIQFNLYTGSRDTIDYPVRNGVRPTEQCGCSSVIIDCNGQSDWFAWCEQRMEQGQRVVFKLNGMNGSAASSFIQYWESRPVAGMIDAYKVKDEPLIADKGLVLDQLHAIHDYSNRPSWLNTVPGGAMFKAYFTMGTSYRDYARIFTIDHYPFEGENSPPYTYKKSLNTYTIDGNGRLTVEPLGMWLSALIDAYLVHPPTMGVTLTPANGFILGNVIQGYHWNRSNRPDAGDSYWVLDSTKLDDQIAMSLGKTPWDGVPTQGSRRLDYTVGGTQLLQFVSVYAWSTTGTDRTHPSQNEALTTLIQTAVQKAQQTLSITGSTIYPAGAGIQPPPTTVAAPVASPSGGTFNATQSVTLTCSTAGASMRYTTNGTTPTSGTGTVYSGAITISATTTLKAIAYKTDLTDSAVTTQVYTINTPSGNAQLSPTAMTLRYETNGSIYLINASGATITRATSSNSAVCEMWGVFSSSGVYLPNGGGDHIVIHAKSVDGSATMTVTLSTGSTLTCAITVAQETCATPVITPATGVYASTQSVTMTCGTSGATIRYTTNGADPTGASTAYSTPLTVSSTTTVKAKAFKASTTDSATATSVITIQTAPSGSPTSCKIFPQASYEAQLDGAVIEVSADQSSWTLLYTISGTPSAGWTTYALSPTTVYRYMRVRASGTKTIRIAELEFYYGSVKKLGGAFSSAFSDGNTPAKAFDGSTSGGYFGAATTGGYIGLDTMAVNNSTPALVPSSLNMPPDDEARVTVANIGALSITTVASDNDAVATGYVASDWFNLNSSAQAGAAVVTVTLSDASTLTLNVRVISPVTFAAPYRSWPVED